MNDVDCNGARVHTMELLLRGQSVCFHATRVVCNKIEGRGVKVTSAATRTEHSCAGGGTSDVVHTMATTHFPPSPISERDEEEMGD